MSHFSDRILRRARQFPELTTEAGSVNGSALAREAGLKQQTVSKLLTGKTENPRLDTMRKVADALDCSLDDLFGDTRKRESSDFRDGVEYALGKVEDRIEEIRNPD